MGSGHLQSKTRFMPNLAYVLIAQDAVETAGTPCRPVDLRLIGLIFSGGFADDAEPGVNRIDMLADLRPLV